MATRFDADDVPEDLHPWLLAPERYVQVDLQVNCVPAPLLKGDDPNPGMLTPLPLVVFLNGAHEWWIDNGFIVVEIDWDPNGGFSCQLVKS